MLGALLLAGCGGDGASTRSEWIEQAEAVCTRTADALDGLDPDAFESQEEFSRAVNEALADYLGDLRALEVPPDDEAEITQWLDLQADLSEAWETYLASDGGEAATEAFAETAEPITTRADRLIRDFGAGGCALDGTPA